MFKPILEKLLDRIPGAQWAVVVGVDGVVIDSSSRAQPPELEILAADYSTQLRSWQRIAEETGTGGVQGSLIFTERGKIVFQMITPDYFLLVGLDEAGISGKARFEVTRSRPEFERELAFE